MNYLKRCNKSLHELTLGNSGKEKLPLRGRNHGQNQAQRGLPSAFDRLGRERERERQTDRQTDRRKRGREKKTELSRKRVSAGGEDTQHKCKSEHMVMHDISSTLKNMAGAGVAGTWSNNDSPPAE